MGWNKRRSGSDAEHKVDLKLTDNMDQRDELLFRTLEALKKAAQVLNTDELAVLCWHCGVTPDQVSDFYEPPRKAA